jgi:hypothetical protein
LPILSSLLDTLYWCLNSKIKQIVFSNRCLLRKITLIWHWKFYDCFLVRQKLILLHMIFNQCLCNLRLLFFLCLENIFKQFIYVLLKLVCLFWLCIKIEYSQNCIFNYVNYMPQLSDTIFVNKDKTRTDKAFHSIWNRMSNNRVTQNID